MSLESGTYLITSKVEQNFAVGRLFAEDKSLNPKRVVVLPEGVEAPKWEIEKLPNGNYILKTRGSFTAKIDNLLFAILMGEPAATEWKLERDERRGENAYVITDANERGEGWVVPETEPYTQIAVRSLIVGPSYPPFYPPNEVFVITPVD